LEKITWRLEESENYGCDRMAQLASVRDEWLRGDVQGLYIAWLTAVTGEMMDDDEMEPLCVSGLGSLTAAQQALSEFLVVDTDLLVGAGMGSTATQYEGVSQREMDKWIDRLPRDEVTALLKQLLTWKAQQAERTIKNRFLAWQRGIQGDRTKAPRRTVGELRKNAEAAEKIRLEQKKRERNKREIRRRKEREVYLKKRSNDFLKVWKTVQQTVERGSGLAYDEACCTLIDLSEVRHKLDNWSARSPSRYRCFPTAEGTSKSVPKASNTHAFTPSMGLFSGIKSSF
jgi:hypothetical protein